VYNYKKQKRLEVDFRMLLGIWTITPCE